MNWKEFERREGKSIPLDVASAVRNYLEDILVPDCFSFFQDNKRLEKILLDAFIDGVDIYCRTRYDCDEVPLKKIGWLSERRARGIASHIRSYAQDMIGSQYWPHEVLELGNLDSVEIAGSQQFGKTGSRNSHSVLAVKDSRKISNYLLKIVRELNDFASFIKKIGKVKK